MINNNNDNDDGMGGLREEIFGGNGKGVENESEGWGNGDGWWRRQ